MQWENIEEQWHTARQDNDAETVARLREEYPVEFGLSGAIKK